VSDGAAVIENEQKIVSILCAPNLQQSLRRVRVRAVKVAWYQKGHDIDSRTFSLVSIQINQDTNIRSNQVATYASILKVVKEFYQEVWFLNRKLSPPSSTVTRASICFC